MHPSDIPNDSPGKSSNISWAARKASERYSLGIRDDVIVTVIDGMFQNRATLSVGYTDSLQPTVISPPPTLSTSPRCTSNSQKLHQLPCTLLQLPSTEMRTLFRLSSESPISSGALVGYRAYTRDPRYLLQPRYTLCPWVWRIRLVDGIRTAKPSGRICTCMPSASLR